MCDGSMLATQEHEAVPEVDPDTLVFFMQPVKPIFSPQERVDMEKRCPGCPMPRESQCSSQGDSHPVCEADPEVLPVLGHLYLGHLGQPPKVCGKGLF